MEEQKKGKCVYCGNYRGYYTKGPDVFQTRILRLLHP